MTVSVEHKPLRSLECDLMVRAQPRPECDLVGTPPGRLGSGMGKTRAGWAMSPRGTVRQPGLDTICVAVKSGQNRSAPQAAATVASRR